MTSLRAAADYAGKEILLNELGVVFNRRSDDAPTDADTDPVRVALAETNPTGRYLMPALAFEQGYRVIGLGMWLGLIMAANVWFVIWPNQKKALGLKPADDEAKAKSARTALTAFGSR